jgi:DNA-directed RNA polymerase specialized sigma24 family protein
MNLEAFENRVLPAKNKLFRFALRFLGNEEEAKDVVQEVFIRVWNGRDQMSQVEKLGGLVHEDNTKPVARPDPDFEP